MRLLKLVYVSVLFQIGESERFNFDECGVTRSCMTLPDGCKPGQGNLTAPCTVVSWRTETNSIDVILYGEFSGKSGDWDAVGFSETNDAVFRRHRTSVPMRQYV